METVCGCMCQSGYTVCVSLSVVPVCVWVYFILTKKKKMEKCFFSGTTHFGDITNSKGFKCLNLPHEKLNVLVSVSPKSEVLFMSSDSVVNFLVVISIM